MNRGTDHSPPIAWLLVLLAVALTAAAGCGGSASSDPQPEVPPVAAKYTPTRVDLDAIFPPGPGRDLVLNNCQSCHVWVPIVILQMDKNAWHRNSVEHRGRVEALSDEDFETLYEYVSSTFTPERPVPELPAALLETWTTY
jgi:mono/diheme cytochrome c family protein